MINGLSTTTTIQKVDAISLFTAAVVSGNKTSLGLSLLSSKDIRSMIGKKSKGLTCDFLENIRNQQVIKMQLAEVQSAADFALSSIIAQYPKAEVRIGRNRKFEVWLDGIPKGDN